MPAAGDIARTSLILIFAFAGIESALIPSGEVRDSERTVPRAIALAMLGITALYIALQVVAQGILGDALAQSTVSPLADAAGASLGAWARSLLLAGASISMFGYLGGMTLSIPRIVYALARDGFLPRALAMRCTRSIASPQAAIVAQAILTLALAITGTFEKLAIFANVSALALYFGCAAAAWKLGQSPIVPVLACGVIAWLLTGLTLDEWLGFGACLLVASIVYFAVPLSTRRTVRREIDRPTRRMSAMKAVPVLTVALVAAFLAVVAAQPTQRYDLLIRNGRVMDGTGNPWFPADIAVQNGRIVAIGKLANAQAARVIDATGKFVTPGFIDIHSHADDGSGPRGGFRDRIRCDDRRRISSRRASPPSSSTRTAARRGRSTDQRALLEKTGIGPNAMLLVGHGTVRRRVMGDDVRRPARADEITRMRALVKEALQEGAVGMSAGLEYDPGRWSTTEEVVELATRAARVQRHLHFARAQRRQRSAVVRAEPGWPERRHAARRGAGDDRDRREDRRPRRRLTPQGEGRTLLGIERGGDQR